MKIFWLYISIRFFGATPCASNITLSMQPKCQDPNRLRFWVARMVPNTTHRVNPLWSARANLQLPFGCMRHIEPEARPFLPTQTHPHALIGCVKIVWSTYVNSLLPLVRVRCFREGKWLDPTNVASTIVYDLKLSQAYIFVLSCSFSTVRGFCCRAVLLSSLQARAFC